MSDSLTEMMASSPVAEDGISGLSNACALFIIIIIFNYRHDAQLNTRHPIFKNLVIN